METFQQKAHSTVYLMANTTDVYAQNIRTQSIGVFTLSSYGKPNILFINNNKLEGKFCKINKHYELRVKHPGLMLVR